MSNVYALNPLVNMEYHELQVQLWERRFAGETGAGVDKLKAEIAKRDARFGRSSSASDSRSTRSTP